MKKRLFITACLVIMAALCIIPAIAAETPDAVTVTLGTATGTATWTNARDFVVFKLVSIEVFGSLATSTCAVTRVRSARTNTVASIETTNGVGIHRETNDIYLFKGDVLRFANDPATGAVAEITGLLLP